MSEIVKQEGDFKISKTKKPRSLVRETTVTKVDLTEKPIDQEVTKVTIPSEVVEIEKTIEPIVDVVQKTVEQNSSFDNLIEEITDNNEPVVEVSQQVSEQVNEFKENRVLPENIEKLVSFMEETGGTIDDYTRLNADYSNVNQDVLLREYYKSTKPHLDQDELQFLIEDSFFFDEDLEEEREIRRKKLAYKEEVAKAKSYLDSIKSKYYDEIKLRPGVTQEQKEASEFFNRYKKTEDESKARHDRFKTDTKRLFNSDFKGFEYNIGEKRFRYGVQNPDQVADKQSDISNFVGKFLDKEGNVTDTVNYHKALYTAMNSDKIAQHFYEQGKADAVKEVITNSKNPSLNQPRQTSGEVFINGLRVKSVSGFDSSKLRIQTKKFNN